MENNPIQGFGVYSAMLADRVGQIKGEILADQLAQQQKMADFQKMLDVSKINQQADYRDWQKQTDERDFNYKVLSDQFSRDMQTDRMNIDKMRAGMPVGSEGMVQQVKATPADILAEQLSPTKRFNENEELLNLKKQLEARRKDLHDFTKARNDLSMDNGSFMEDDGYVTDPVTGKEVLAGERTKQLMADTKKLEDLISTKEKLLGKAVVNPPADVEKHLKGLRPDKKGRTTITAPDGQKRKVSLKKYSTELRTQEATNRLLNNGQEDFNKYMKSLNIPESEKIKIAEKAIEEFITANEGI